MLRKVISRGNIYAETYELEWKELGKNIADRGYSMCKGHKVCRGLANLRATEIHVAG